MNSKLALLASTGLACAVAAQPAAAQEVTSGVSLSVGGSYDTSPFLDTEERDGSSASGFVEVEPRVRYVDETSTFQLSGGLRYSYYTALDRTNEAARLQLTGASRLDESTSLNTSAHFNTSRAIGIDLLRVDPTVLGPDGELPVPPDIDPTLIGQRGRTTSFGFGGGLSKGLSAVSSLSLGVNSNWRLFDNDTGRESVTTSANVGYARTLSERASLNIGFSAAKSNYRGGDLGDAVTLSPSAGATLQTSQTGKLSFNAGASFVRTDLDPLGKVNSTFLVGNVTYCDRALAGSVCLTAARSAQATGFSGVSAVTSVNFGWSRNFGERDSISLSGRYSRSSRSTLIVDDELVAATTELYGVNARYRHRFNDRMSAFVAPSFTDASSSLVERKANFGIMAGLTVSLGNIR